MGHGSHFTMTRFHDHGISEFAFEGEFAVRCPKCQHQAYVINDLHGHQAESARLSCTSCGYSAHWNRGSYQGPSIGIAKRRCRYCGRWLKRRYFGSPHKHEARLRCPNCNTEMREPISWSRSLQSTPTDPYFGCPLWFVGQMKGHVFWAYNAAHLSFIRNYVAATVRIRRPNMNSSLASRLPAFLLDRKNRGAVLKKIAGLEQM
jgi:hypothetical protein